MGDWTIVIEGMGVHDEDRPDSIEGLTKEFVKSLHASGVQTVSRATVTKGGKAFIV